MEITIAADIGRGIFEVEIDGLTHSRHFNREDAVAEIRTLTAEYRKDVARAETELAEAQRTLDGAREDLEEMSDAVAEFLKGEDA